MKDIWDKRYTDSYVYGTAPNDFLANIPFEKAKGDVVCLAEGQGRNAVYLATKGFNVSAIDFSKEGLRKANELAGKNNVQIQTIEMDLNSFKAEAETLDGVVGIFAHFPEKTKKHVFSEISKGLKKGGFLIWEVYSTNQLKHKTGGPPNIELLYSTNEIELMLGNLFEFHVFHEIEREVFEGKLHNGLAAVIQLYAIKK